MSFNTVQDKTFQYLASGGTRHDRVAALKMLTEDQFFRAAATDHDSRERLRQLLADYRYTTRFCSEGIRKFKDALLLGPQEHVVEVKLRLTVTDDRNNNRTQLERNTKFRVANHLIGITLPAVTASTGPITVKSAEFEDGSSGWASP